MGFASEWVKGKDEDNIQGTIRVWSHLTARAGKGRRRGQLAGAVTAPVWDFWWDIIKATGVGIRQSEGQVGLDVRMAET